MPEIKVTRHFYIENESLNYHAREGLWVGPKAVLWLTYDGFPLELVLRRDENGDWEATNVFHYRRDWVCPFCDEQNQNEWKCKNAADYMDQLAEDALNHPSFRLIALFEL